MLKWIGYLLSLVGAFSPGFAQSPLIEHHHVSGGETAPAVSMQAMREEGLKIPDLALIDQNGRTVHFYKNLIEGRTVAINFIFTTCTTICLPMGANFAHLEKMLGARAGHEVNLISVSIDPETDTPARLKVWAGRFHGGPGWTLVTGSKPEIDRLLKALGAFTADKQDHSSLALIGNARTGEWIRQNALASPDAFLRQLDKMSRGGRL
jgi:protein SCO1/2